VRNVANLYLLTSDQCDPFSGLSSVDPGVIFQPPIANLISLGTENLFFTLYCIIKLMFKAVTLTTDSRNTGVER
jgi:hypothetical protein